MVDPDFVPTPEMIAAAWDQWKPRRGNWQANRIGPGPAFREAIAAAIRVMPDRTVPHSAEPKEETQ